MMGGFFLFLKILCPSGGDTGDGALEERGVPPVGHGLARPRATEPRGPGHPSGGAVDAPAHLPTHCLAGPEEQ